MLENVASEKVRAEKLMLRNPTIEIGGIKFLCVGDPHLGKKYPNAFPDRRAEMEERHWNIFEVMVTLQDSVKVIMGDIFDKSKVDEAVLLRTAEILNKSTSKIYILEGNHDNSKTKLEKTSFDVLEQLFKHNQDIVFVRGVVNLFVGNNIGISLVGWEYNRSIREQVKDIDPTSDYLFTHVDLNSFNDDKSNCVPFDLIKNTNIKYVINGHEHLPKREVIDGIHYIGTGSLIPFDRSQQGWDDVDTYAHLFVTNPKDKSDWTDKIVYFESENLDDVPEFEGAYGVILKRLGVTESEQVLVEIDEISIPVLLQRAADITGLDQNAVKNLVTEFAEIEANE